MKKRLSITLILLLLMIVFGSTLFAAAEQDFLQAQQINQNENVNYKLISTITSFDAFDSIYYSDQENLYKDTQKISDAVSCITFYEDKMLHCNSEGIFYNQELLFSGEFLKIVVFGQCLYASSSDKVFVFDVLIDIENDSLSLSSRQESYQFSAHIADLCVSSQAVYLRLLDSNLIYKIHAGQSGVVGEVEGLKAISATAKSDLLFCLTNSQVISYKDSGDMLNIASSIMMLNGEKIAAGDEKVFVAITDGGSFSILCSDFNLLSFDGFVASRGEYDYFYRSPMGISSRYNNIYVSDTKNNRICVLSGENVSHITHYMDEENPVPYYEPKSAALSLSGELFVAHKNKLTNHSTGKTLELIDPQNRSLIIEKMVIDSKGNIYVLGVHLLSQDSFVYHTNANLIAFTALDFSSPSAIGYKAGGEVLVYDGEAVKTISGDVVAQCQPLKDFCLDFSGKIFGLTLDGNLISIENGKQKNHGGRYDRIALSNIDSEICDYGDLLLLDSLSSSLLKISAIDAGVADASKHYTVPDVENDATSHKIMQNCIATLKNDAPLFDQPNESSSSCVLEKDSIVFIRYDVDTPEDMYFVVAEKLTGSPQPVQEVILFWGYLYRSALNPPLEYALPPKNTARVLLDVGEYKYIYKYPSLKANKIGQMSKGDWVKPLDFAVLQGNWYEDISLNKWIRVAIGDGEGYMLELGISWSLFSSSVSQPNTNATIKKDAPLYVYNAAKQKYELLDSVHFLEKGKRVEVKTPFDSSSKYTRVIFSIKNDDGNVEVIDIECFVETKYIDFDGVDILKLVAFVAIALSVVILIILIVWIIKKRNQTPYKLV